MLHAGVSARIQISAGADGGPRSQELACLSLGNFLGCLEVPVGFCGWVVDQPSTLSLPTQVEVELRCDNKPINMDQILNLNFVHVEVWDLRLNLEVVVFKKNWERGKGKSIWKNRKIATSCDSY